MKSLWASRSDEFWKAEFGTAAARKWKLAPPRRKPLRKEVLDILLEYTQNAYAVCVGLAARENIPLWDRALWSLVILGSVSYTGWILYQTHAEYDAHPMETAVISPNLPLSQFPFPSVTICPRSKIKKSVALSIIMSTNNLSSINETRLLPALRLLQSVTSRHWMAYEKPQIIEEEVFQLFGNIRLFDFMLEVLPPCEEIFKSCLWASTAFGCCDLFKAQKTRSGFCYAFNSLTTIAEYQDCKATAPPPDGADYLWYENRPDTRECELFRMSGAGPFSALQVHLKALNPAEKLGNLSADLGFDLIVGSPKEFPEPDSGAYVPEKPGLTTYAIVSYSETSVSPAVRGVSHDKRGCFFEDEYDDDSPLALATTRSWYSQNICHQFCLSLFFLEKCGCFYYLSSTAQEQLYGSNSDLNCSKCLPVCGGTLYKTQFISQPSVFWGGNRSPFIVNVFYRGRTSAVKYMQQLRLDRLDTLFKYGGLLSLLLGLSLVSLAQLLFYLCKASAVWWPRVPRVPRLGGLSGAGACGAGARLRGIATRATRALRLALQRREQRRAGWGW